MENKLFVTRKSFTSKKDGKEYFNYVLKGTIRRTVGGKLLEKEVEVDFVAKDQGGYEVLDIIFFNTDSAELVIEHKTMTNDKTGEVLSFNEYTIQSVDDDGTVFGYKVKLQRESDKSLLDAILRSAAKA